jgi:hypothetical protein
LILRQVRNIELLEEGPHMGLDRVHAEVELLGDRLVGGRRGEGGAVLEGPTEGDEDPSLGG